MVKCWKALSYSTIGILLSLSAKAADLLFVYVKAIMMAYCSFLL
jgi:hypothetical protein